jgi:hypothetical protein
MVVRILDIVAGADTADQGRSVLDRLRSAIHADGGVTVSFQGVQSATSSFVNSAFVPLLDDHALDSLKQRLRVIHSTRQINDMIKTRLNREALASA